MDLSRWRRDVWRWPTLVLWLAFFGLGLSPEWTFYYFRSLGLVVTQRAAINAPWLIEAGLLGYLVLFTYQRCCEAGLGVAETRGKSLQAGVIALFAFLPLRPELVANYQYIPVPEYRWLVVGLAGVKAVSWFYLFSVIFRYYVIDGYGVFTRMPTVFPSLHHREPEPDKCGPPNPEP